MDQDLRELEEANSLLASNISCSRWVKPIQRQDPNQVCMHLPLVMNGAKCTNSIIQSGLFICHKKVWLEKCKREPTRCLKCQGWGHLASDCKIKHNICGTCGKRHHMADCNNHTAKHYCASCNMNTPTRGWDWSCPDFIWCCEEIYQKYAENAMPFFVTKKPWMQVSLPPKPPKPTQQVSYGESNSVLQQIMLLYPLNLHRSKTGWLTHAQQPQGAREQCNRIGPISQRNIFEET